MDKYLGFSEIKLGAKMAKIMVFLMDFKQKRAKIVGFGPILMYFGQFLMIFVQFWCQKL